jgi:hypothetical protein
MINQNAINFQFYCYYYYLNFLIIKMFSVLRLITYLGQVIQVGEYNLKIQYQVVRLLIDYKFWQTQKLGQ